MTTTIERQPLTARQQRIFEYVWLFRKQNGYCVSVRDIMQQFGISSPNGAMCHLKALRRKNWVTWDERTPRTIRPAEENDDSRDQLRRDWDAMHEASDAQ